MELDQRIRMMEEILTRQLKVSANADTKVSTLIGINTTMLAVVAALITEPKVLNVWLILLTVLAVGGLLLALLFLSLGSAPRTSKASPSIIFFGQIVKRDRDTYRERVKAITEEEYLDDLAHQTHRMAEIASQKYLWIQRAQKAWYASIIPWLLTVYMLYGG